MMSFSFGMVQKKVIQPVEYSYRLSNCPECSRIKAIVPNQSDCPESKVNESLPNWSKKQHAGSDNIARGLAAARPTRSSAPRAPNVCRVNTTINIPGARGHLIRHVLPAPRVRRAVQERRVLIWSVQHGVLGLQQHALPRWPSTHRKLQRHVQRVHV